jgi:hypothetical protein
MRRLALTLLSLVALLFATGPRQALACNCAPLPSNDGAVLQHLNRSGAVFIGTVLRGDSQTGTQVRVERAYKGVRAGDTVTVSSSGGDCGYEIGPVGSSHLLSVTNQAGRSPVDLCGSFAVEFAIGPNVPPFVAALDRLAPSVATPTQPVANMHGADNFHGDDSILGHNDGPRWFFPAMAVALLLAATGAVVTLTRRRR